MRATALPTPPTRRLEIVAGAGLAAAGDDLVLDPLEAVGGVAIVAVEAARGTEVVIARTTRTG